MVDERRLLGRRAAAGTINVALFTETTFHFDVFLCSDFIATFTVCCVGCCIGNNIEFQNICFFKH